MVWVLEEPKIQLWEMESSSRIRNTSCETSRKPVRDSGKVNDLFAQGNLGDGRGDCGFWD